MGELTGCARLGGCPDPFACQKADKCAAFAPSQTRLRWPEDNSKQPVRTPPAVMPTWPDQPSGKVWDDFGVQFQAAAIARVKLGRATLVMMAAQCDECHGRRCQYCENTWKIIDQLEVPAWLR